MFDYDHSYRLDTLPDEPAMSVEEEVNHLLYRLEEIAMEYDLDVLGEIELLFWKMSAVITSPENKDEHFPTQFS